LGVVEDFAGVGLGDARIRLFERGLDGDFFGELEAVPGEEWKVSVLVPFAVDRRLLFSAQLTLFHPSEGSQT
jgi:hypothetical protein